MSKIRLIFLSLLALVLASTISGCSSIFFFPTKEYIATPDQLGLNYSELSIPVGKPGSLNRPALSGWWLPASESMPVCGTVVLFHGNAQNMSNHLFGVTWLPPLGFNLLIFDYRGYGSSGGQADVPALVADGAEVLHAALEKLDNNEVSRGSKIVVYGQSIGGAIASTVAAKFPARDRIAAVVLESSFRGYPAIVREKLGQFFLTWPFQYPLSWLFFSRYDSEDYIGKIAPTPVLLVHGLADTIVLPENSRRLYQLAGQPKLLWEFETAGHINAFQQPVAREKMVRYLRDAFGCGISSETNR